MYTIYAICVQSTRLISEDQGFDSHTTLLKVLNVVFGLYFLCRLFRDICKTKLVANLKRNYP